MVAGGNVKRQEDVKKILYTGAKRAMLNFSKPGFTETDRRGGKAVWEREDRGVTE